MFKRICYVYQSVPDVAKSCEFFEKKLGFKLHTNQPDVKGLAAGTGYLILRKDEPGFRAVSRGAGANVCVEVEDVDAYHAMLEERGVTVGKITDQPWGQRDFYLNDPDGYSWCFARAMR
jgi:catechol 2,3-dioxygenase-like lactoylglutathione lyase family enzyme